MNLHALRYFIDCDDRKRDLRLGNIKDQSTGQYSLFARILIKTIGSSGFWKNSILV